MPGCLAPSAKSPRCARLHFACYDVCFISNLRPVWSAAQIRQRGTGARRSHRPLAVRGVDGACEHEHDCYWATSVPVVTSVACPAPACMHSPWTGLPRDEDCASSSSSCSCSLTFVTLLARCTGAEPHLHGLRQAMPHADGVRPAQQAHRTCRVRRQGAPCDAARLRAPISDCPHRSLPANACGQMSGKPTLSLRTANRMAQVFHPQNVSAAVCGINIRPWQLSKS